MQTAKVCYLSSDYASLRRTADAYREIIRSKYMLVDNPTEAEVLIVHSTPCQIEAICTRHPSLRDKFVIGYCTWEASHLPDVYKNAISFADEIWTCSEYCRRVFENYHPRVVRIPHVIERQTAVPDSDHALVKRLVGFESGLVYFLSIGKICDKRKNLPVLVRAFHEVAPAMPNARLIVKILPSDSVSEELNDQTILLPLGLSDGAINALYHLSDIYVSVHHAEGWGLTLSDAMIFRRPVVATCYSGNLEFMDSRNSFLLDFTESHIRADDCCFLF
jgi:glycosyltransferase involved in cell wall biosynthesis